MRGFLIRRVGIAAALMLCGTVRETLAADFGLVGLSASDNTLHRIQLDPLESSAIGAMQSYTGPDAAILAEAGAGLAYTINRDTDELFTVRLSDASVVASVLLDTNVSVHRRGLDVSPGGVLHGVFDGPQLRTIDPNTGTTTLVGNIDLGRVEGIAFGDDGTLYAVGTFSNSRASDRLYTLDPNTGLSSFVSALSVQDVDCLTFGPDGYLYGADSTAGIDDLYRINPATGGLTNLGSTGISQLNGLMVSTGPVRVAVDISPGACPNTINTKSHGKLSIVVAGNEQVDVSDIDLSTLRMLRLDGVGSELMPFIDSRGPAPVIVDTVTDSETDQCACVTGLPDGMDDLRLRFDGKEVLSAVALINKPSGTLVELMIVGTLLDGTPIKGSDCLILLSPGRNESPTSRVEAGRGVEVNRPAPCAVDHVGGE